MTKSSKAVDLNKKRVVPEKYRVRPNLSLRGKDIMVRVKNRSLQVQATSNNYSLDKEFDEFRRMDKTDKILKQREVSQTVNNLKNKLNGK